MREATPGGLGFRAAGFRVAGVMRWAAVGLLLAALYGAFAARRWPLVHDAPLIHYVIFLMDHGRVPYRDIVEMNMPGTYLLEWTVMHTLGGGARAWWMWDTLLGAMAVGAGAWIGGRERRWAGVAAGAFAWLVHLSDGPMNMGQRDWVVAVLLLVGFGFLFSAMRRGQPAWMAGFLLCCGAAASIKPPVVAVAAVFVALACWRERGVPGRWLRIVGWSVLGLVPAVAASVLFLVHWGVTREFVGILRGLVPYYAAMGQLDMKDMILRIQPWRLRLLTLGAATLFVLGRGWRRWEESWLLGGMLAGVGLYLIQRKGWSYHLYTEVGFFALWLMFEVDEGLRGVRAQRWMAAGTLVVVGLATPLLLHSERRNVYPMETVTALQADLERLGGAGLSGHVQCLDMTRGSCIDALYREKLMQTTGAIYDFYLFPVEPGPVTGPIQAKFLREITANPPKVFVLSSHSFVDDGYNYDKLGRWPALEQFLGERYFVEREFPRPAHSAGYRIYELK